MKTRLSVLAATLLLGCSLLLVGCGGGQAKADDNPCAGDNPCATADDDNPCASNPCADGEKKLEKMKGNRMEQAEQDE